MASLNEFYLTHVASAATREMVDAHAVLHGGRLDTLCYVTSAAVAWLLSGVDCAPPFAGVWVNQGTGPADADRVIAFGHDDGDEFDEEHTLVALARGGGTIIIDSCLAEGRALTVRVLDAMPPPGQGARFVLLP